MDQAGVKRVNFDRRRRRFSVEAIQPEGDVVRMGVEILHGVSHPPEGLPRRDGILFLKRLNNHVALLFDVGIGLCKGVVVEVEFVVTELPGETVLMNVGVGHNPQRARADRIAKRFKHDLDVIFGEHLPDYKRL